MMLFNCGVGELLRISWTARRPNQSILKEINPEYSLEGLLLKLKLQHFDHLMGRTDSLDKTLMLWKIEGKRIRGQRGWDGWMASLACNAGNVGSVSGLGRSPGEGKGYSFQYSGLENSVDHSVQGVAKSRTRLSHWTVLFESVMLSNHLILWCLLLLLPSVFPSITVLFPVSQLFAPVAQSIGASASASVFSVFRVDFL